MNVAKGTTPCFIKGLENLQSVPLLIPFVCVILASDLKIAAVAEGSWACFESGYNDTSCCNMTTEDVLCLYINFKTVLFL